MVRLTAIALLLLTAGCARQRVAYEVHMTSEPVARRTPRRNHHERSFPASAYVHGDPRHRCDARCDTYWPDVYAHGHVDHRCDSSCASFQPAYASGSTTTWSSSSYQSPTYVASPLTGQSAGVRVGVTYDPTPVRAAPVAVKVYAHGHAYHRCDASCASFRVVYAHGHARHRCDRSCGSYGAVVVYSHGHASHRCGAGCSAYVVASYPHGHVRHRCGSSCRVYDYPHGHGRHVCTSLCVAGVTLRTSNGRFSLQIGGSRPHGDRLHACNSACSWYTPPSRFYAHGHRLHACGSGCGLFDAGRRWSHDRSRHDHLRRIDRHIDRHRDHYRSQRRSRGGINLGFGVRIR